MNKEEFLRRLERALPVGPEEKQEILADYREHFAMGLAEGQTQEEIASALGDPRALGRIYGAAALVKKAGAEKSAGNIVRAVFAVISLSFFNLVFVSGIFFGIVGALIGLWAAGIALALSGLAVLFAGLLSPFLPFFDGLMLMESAGLAFTGVGLAALGALACIGLYYVTLGAYKLTLSYLRLNLRIIKGNKTEEV